MLFKDVINVRKLLLYVMAKLTGLFFLDRTLWGSSVAKRSAVHAFPIEFLTGGRG